MVARTPTWHEPAGIMRAYWYFSIKAGVVELRCRVYLEKQGKWVDSSTIDSARHSLLNQQLTALERLLAERRRRAPW